MLLDDPLADAMLAPRAKAVEADFPGWHVWRSAGCWWATRTGAGARWDGSGVPMTVDAGSEGELRGALARYAAAA